MSKKKITALYITACLLLTLAGAESVANLDWLCIGGLILFMVLGLVGILNKEWIKDKFRHPIVALLIILQIIAVSAYIYRRIYIPSINDTFLELNNVVMLGLSTVLILFLVILQLKIRNMQRLVELQNALKKIEILKESIKESTAPSQTAILPTADDLRMRIRKELETMPYSQSVSPQLMASPIYARLNSMIKAEKPISDGGDEWNELEQTVIGCSPEFIRRLQLLTNGRITTNELQMALLIKCGFTISQMTKLLCRTRGAIISRRETLSVRMFGEKLGSKYIEKVIMQL